MAIIFFDGFERYGPPSNPNLFSFNGATANLIGTSSASEGMLNQGFLQDWTSIGGENGSGGNSLIYGRQGGTSVAYCHTHVNNGSPSLTRTLPTNYSHVILGFAMQASGGSNTGVNFIDSGTGTQCSFWFDGANRPNFSRSAVSSGANNLFASTRAIPICTWHYFEIDLTIGSGTSGSFVIYVDGVQLTSSGGTNTQAQSAITINQIQFTTVQSGQAIDDIYLLDNTGGSPLNAPLGDIDVQTLFPSSDSSVTFTCPALSFGWVAQETTATAAPGANTIALVPFIPTVNCTVNSVGLIPQATSAGAKFKGVIYSDATNAPGSLLSSGNEVVGAVAASNLTLPLVTPQSLTGGTQYWLGYITDTSVTIEESDIAVFSAKGQTKANTYASGAPAGPLSGMTTGQPTWSIWANCTSPASNYAVINQVPNQMISTASIFLSYMNSSGINNEDLYNHTALSTTSTTVKAVKVTGCVNKSGAFARSFDFRLKSNTNAGNTTSSGNTILIGLTSAMAYFASYFTTDPDTTIAWTAAGVNNCKIGYKITL